MIFTDTQLPGVYLVDLEPHPDDRGFFARTFCQQEFSRKGLCASYPQCNLSQNRARGTLRGMHYNEAPHEEAKLVRCQSGAIFDVVVDVRRHSPTRGKWLGVELSQRNHRMIYVPEGLAHGFLTLTPDAEVFYQMSRSYVPGVGTGLRYDDPSIGISWPEPPQVISERDRSYPDWQQRKAGP